MKNRIAIAFIIMQLLVALAFAATYQGLSQDEDAALRDVSRYADEGVTVQTIREHVNAAGPLAFVAMSLVGEAIGSLHPGGRLASLLGASLSCLLIFLLLRELRASTSAALVGSALLLVNPYAPLAAGSMLTESFSIAVLLAGLLLWYGAFNAGGGPIWGWRIWVGGAVLGLAVTARQYYLAVVFGVWFVTFWLDCPMAARSDYRGIAKRVARNALFGVWILLPTIGLALIWGDLSPPLLKAGVSHPGWSAAVGLDLYRPFSALIVLGVYSVPLAALVARTEFFRSARCFLSLTLAVLAGLLVDESRLVCDSDRSVLCGPIDGLYQMSRDSGFGVAFAALLVSIATLCWWSIGSWLKREDAARNPVSLVCIVSLSAFLVEQLFVGGNIPFYERYVQQVWPLMILLLGPLALQTRLGVLVATCLPLILYGNWRVFRLLM